MANDTKLETIWNSIKKYNVALIWGAVVFIHTYAYLPYIQKKISNELKVEVSRSLTDSIKSNLINEINHKQIGFVLQLSDQLNIPISKLPMKLAESVYLTDSAKKFYPLVNIVQDFNKIIHCGLKAESDKIYYLSSNKTIYPCFEDANGVYYVNKKGVKKYVE
jgi:hypothetical protein